MQFGLPLPFVLAAFRGSFRLAVRTEFAVQDLDQVYEIRLGPNLPGRIDMLPPLLAVVRGAGEEGVGSPDRRSLTLKAIADWRR